MLPTRDAYPRGVPCWVDVPAADPEAATAFYGEVFGWQFEPEDRGLEGFADAVGWLARRRAARRPAGA